jgi:hypothetical protein
MLCTHVVLMFTNWFCGKYQYNKFMFNLAEIYSFIHVSGCVGMNSSALLYPGAYDAIKTALHVRRDIRECIACT